MSQPKSSHSPRSLFSSLAAVSTAALLSACASGSLQMPIPGGGKINVGLPAGGGARPGTVSHPVVTDGTYVIASQATESARAERGLSSLDPINGPHKGWDTPLADPLKLDLLSNGELRLNGFNGVKISRPLDPMTAQKLAWCAKNPARAPMDAGCTIPPTPETIVARHMQARASLEVPVSCAAPKMLTDRQGSLLISSCNYAGGGKPVTSSMLVETGKDDQGKPVGKVVKHAFVPR